ncbi:phosphogluconate dehydratase [Jannaschia aquimarina]|uniref:Phosphogluconate dehydratase n=1 Tax=Jannaschia aquimarina TaxID=935700 RepID=A0A0D1CQC5_9RHOB|nr:phosphogluconate dehydratase [Jannaschia aquimarina]KIT16982.1 Phosphogluconate dehydratase [Jannaschia aquimarina]SNT33060.1 6-phosphogluconate dehydratase [Jannaschia aquimarina]
MPLDARIAEITDRIRDRSRDSREAYLKRMRDQAAQGVRRAHLACGNQAHAYAAMGEQKDALVADRVPNIGIVTAYNDMLSAHQPFKDYPDRIKAAAARAGATAQVAGGVPAMCDGVTQGQTGMELSLFSRDVIALATGVALSHNTFDSVLYLGICDKIVPGLVIAASTFGYLPGIFVPAGPMTSGLPNEEKARVRRDFAEGKVGRDKLMEAEMASYHGPGTCTFYGTANSNQMLMEFMGLHLPGASFVNPGTPLRDALTDAATERATAITNLGNGYTPVCDILDEKAYVNGLVGLMATGGSTNLVLHLVAMARASGVRLTCEDFDAISEATPLMAKVYPNGLADVNHFHAAGGLPFMIGRLLDAGLLHEDVRTVAGDGLSAYATEPKLGDDGLHWQPGPRETLNDRILRDVPQAFARTGGLREMRGNLGLGVTKVSAVAPEHRVIEAPARIFSDQEEVKAAFRAGELDRDVIVVVRFQGPKANGMPELHALTPPLSVVQGRGYKVALVTDGRMSGASGKVPSAIHVAPEAAAGGPLARLRDGDVIRYDAEAGTLTCLTEGALDRDPVPFDPATNAFGLGREMFETFRANVSSADTGAAIVV